MRFALLILMSVASPSAAEPEPRVKLELTPKDEAWVGQRVTLAVTLSTPDLFAGVPSFEIPPISGVVVVPPTTSPVIGSETIGGDTFTTQRHEFALYVQRSGVVQIPSFQIQFETNAGFGKPTVRRRVVTGAVSFTAKTPPGAEGLGLVIAARDLKIIDQWEPEPKAPKRGAAFTRTVTLTATDVPGMVFPPLRMDDIDGLTAYPKPPRVDDHADRGLLTGKRVDSVTYVCEKPGVVVIPDRTLTWFDLDAKELRTVKLSGRTFTISSESPAEPGPVDLPLSTQWRSRWEWILAAVIGAASFIWLVFARILPWRNRVRAEHAQSEEAYFRRFRHKCRTSDVHGVYLALLEWLQRFGPMTLDEFSHQADDPGVTEALDSIRNRVYARSDVHSSSEWSAQSLLEKVELGRRTIRKSNDKSSTSQLLPPLNPAG